MINGKAKLTGPAWGRFIGDEVVVGDSTLDGWYKIKDPSHSYDSFNVYLGPRNDGAGWEAEWVEEYATDPDFPYILHFGVPAHLTGEFSMLTHHSERLHAPLRDPNNFWDKAHITYHARMSVESLDEAMMLIGALQLLMSSGLRAENQDTKVIAYVTAAGHDVRLLEVTQD